MLDETFTLGVGASREFVLALRPGAHTVSVTASHGVVETVPIVIPDTGDTAIEVSFHRGGASVTTTT